MSEPPAEPEADTTPTAVGDDAEFGDVPAGDQREKLERKPFLEHLSDLRAVLIKIAVIFVVCVVASFAAREPIFRLLRMPLRALEVQRGLEPGAIELIALGPADVFGALMTIAFSVAIGLSLPFALYFVGRFVAPALTRRERRMLAPGLIAGILLFAAGVAFAFLVTSPFVMNFLWSLAEGMGWRNEWTARFYFGFLSRFVFVTGMTFELPLVLVILVRLGIVPIRTLRKYRRHAIIAILAVSALFTPPDAPSMFMVAGPMYVLYEVSIIASTILERRRRQAR